MAAFAAIAAGLATRYLIGGLALGIVAAIIAGAVVAATAARLVRGARFRRGLVARLDDELDRLRISVLAIDEDRIADIIEAAQREGATIERTSSTAAIFADGGWSIRFVEHHADGTATVHSGESAPGMSRRDLIADLHKWGLTLDGISV